MEMALKHTDVGGGKFHANERCPRFCKNRTHSFLVAIRSNRFRTCGSSVWYRTHRFAMDNRSSNWSQRACNGSKQSGG